MLATMTRSALVAASLALAAPALAQEAPPEEISQAVDAAETTGVLDALLGGGEVTVFVPTNDALAAAPQDALADLMADSDALASVIQGYAVEGNVMAADVIEMAGTEGTDVTTLGGGTLNVMVEDGTVMLRGKGDTVARVITPDLQFGTITIHVIDAAILPNDAM